MKSADAARARAALQTIFFNLERCGEPRVALLWPDARTGPALAAAPVQKLQAALQVEQVPRNALQTLAGQLATQLDQRALAILKP